MNHSAICYTALCKCCITNTNLYSQNRTGKMRDRMRANRILASNKKITATEFSK